MASEQSTDKLLDLLYGELSADEAKSARASMEEDSAAREELAEFEALRAQIRDGLQFETPRASVREAILAEASKQAVRRVDASGRAPRDDGSQTQSFWRRAAQGKGSQMALVATVLLAGAFVMNVLSPRDAAMGTFQEPAPTAQLRPAQTAAAATGDAIPAVEEESQELAKAEEKGLDELAAGAAELAYDAKPVEQAAQRAVAAEPDVARMDTDRQGNRERRASGPEPVERPAVAKKSAPKTAAKPADSPRPLTKTAAVNDYLADVAKEDSGDGLAASRSTSKSKDKYAEFAANAPAADEPTAPAAEKAEKKVAAAPGSLDAAEDAYAERNWRGVVQASDAVVEGSGSAVEKARALELKALAYVQMGMTRQAYNVYQNIVANYPGYQPDRMQAQLNELDRKLNVRPAPAEKTRSKSSADYEFDSNTLE